MLIEAEAGREVSYVDAFALVQRDSPGMCKVGNRGGLAAKADNFTAKPAAPAPSKRREDYKIVGDVDNLDLEMMGEVSYVTRNRSNTN